MPELTGFSTWKEVVAHAGSDEPLWYQAPMDARAHLVGVRRIYNNGKIRIDPLSRDADNFTADRTHLGRFFRQGDPCILAPPQENPPVGPQWAEFEQSAQRRSYVARKEYEKTHWGEKGRQAVEETSAPDPNAGELVELGELSEIVYRTKKGGDRTPMEYEHRFKSPRPKLCYNDTGLVICGGNYQITKRGIVG